MSVTLSDLIGGDEIYDIPASTTSPIIPVTGNQNTFFLKTVGVGASITFLKVVCEIGF